MIGPKLDPEVIPKIAPVTALRFDRLRSDRRVVRFLDLDLDLDLIV